MSVILEIKDLSYSYRGNWLIKRIDAVRGVSLSVNSGEAFGFLGHNGAGKTTTIKCILGLIKHKGGEVRIFGRSNQDLSQRGMVGYLPEQPYFYDYLTVGEIMQLYATLSGIPAAERSTAISQALDIVKVSARSKSPMRSLSKGLTQRVGLAQAIVAKPKLLILDEPFSGLDPIGRKEFRDIFFELKNSGTALFICSHVLSDVEFLCDRVSIMAHGEIKGIFDIRDRSALGAGGFELIVRGFAGKEEALRAGSQSALVERDARGEKIRLVYSDRAAGDTGLHVALHSQLEIESYHSIQGSLEELFVKLVKFEEAGKR